MIDVIRAMVLGLVQGLTEFLPVSSSGHLVLVPFFLGWDKPTLAFDVALHLGTFAAVVLYFRRELLAMARGLVGLDRRPDGLLYRRLGVYLVVASVPVAVAGYSLEGVVSEAFESPLTASLLLLVTASLLVGGERLRARRIASGSRVATAAAPGGQAVAPADAPVEETSAGPHLPVGDDPLDPSGATLRQVTVRQALLVGVAQCLALLPGVSRSGSTITAGLAVGMTRETATRFSFLLSLPALLGAGILKLGDLTEVQEFSGIAIAAGVATAFVSGYAAIAYLVALVARAGLTVFARYCVAAAAVGIVVSLLRA